MTAWTGERIGGGVENNGVDNVNVNVYVYAHVVCPRRGGFPSSLLLPFWGFFLDTLVLAVCPRYGRLDRVNGRTTLAIDSTT